MNENVHPAVMKMTQAITNGLSDEELAAVLLAAQSGTDPRGKLGYEKARALFTEENGTRMHHATQSVVEAIASERLGRK